MLVRVTATEGVACWCAWLRWEAELLRGAGVMVAGAHKPEPTVCSGTQVLAQDRRWQRSPAACVYAWLAAGVMHVNGVERKELAPLWLGAVVARQSRRADGRIDTVSGSNCKCGWAAVRLASWVGGQAPTKLSKCRRMAVQ